MKKYKFSKKFKKIVNKLYYQDKRKYLILKKKVEQIINSEKINHYKNLRKPMHQYKRVHINSNFVLIFEHDESEETIIFENFDHHKNIYK